MSSTYNYIEGLERIDVRLQANVDSNRIPSIPQFEECGSSGTIMCYGTVVYILFEFPEDEDKVDENLKIKITECFFSESCQIFRSNSSCRDVIVSDHEITAVYNTALKVEIDEVINDLARVRTLVPIIEKKANMTRGMLNVKLSAYYGSLNMTVVESSDFSKHFLWSGKAIRTSHQMLDETDNSSILINKVVWNNLSESNQKLFNPHDLFSENYEGNIVNVAMNNWLDSNK